MDKGFHYYHMTINGRKKFPVLYLQHGWGEDETAWRRSLKEMAPLLFR